MKMLMIEKHMKKELGMIGKMKMKKELEIKKDDISLINHFYIKLPTLSNHFIYNNYSF